MTPERHKYARKWLAARLPLYPFALTAPTSQIPPLMQHPGTPGVSAVLQLGTRTWLFPSAEARARFASAVSDCTLHDPTWRP